MSEQNGKVATLQRPTTNDPEAWKQYWKAVQPKEWFEAWGYWRTEPEIDAERQKYLAERRNITPNIEQGIYPFKDVKLNRADVEWLLATHENGHGPVDWSDKSQRERGGLDLRGADLREINLSQLPLAKMRGGVRAPDRLVTTLTQRLMAAVHLERSNLTQIHLEEATLRNAHLNHANLQYAHLEMSDCAGIHLEGAFLNRSCLDGINLQRAYFDTGTYLDNNSLGNDNIGYVFLADVRWNGVNLTTIQWQQMKMVGEETVAQQLQTMNAKLMMKLARLVEYENAVRGYRQLAVVLQSQGLNEHASYFAYRAQKLQRVVSRRQKKFGQYLFSLFLDLLAGYGYRPGRSVAWYLIIIFGFALSYHILGGLSLYPPDAFVFSIMSFHGRGFFPSLSSETNLHNPLVMLAATEAIVGLLIEISFIATFTQRFFGK